MTGLCGAGLFRHIDWPAEFFAITFARERRFQPTLFARRNIESVPFDFTNDVFLLHLAFETAQRALERLAVAEFDFCHLRIHLPFTVSIYEGRSFSGLR